MSRRQAQSKGQQLEKEQFGSSKRKRDLPDWDQEEIARKQQLEKYKIGRGLDTPEWFLKIIQAELANEINGRYDKYFVIDKEPSKKAMYYGLRNIYTGAIMEPCIICMFLLKLLGEKPTPCLPVSESCRCMRMRPGSFRGKLAYIFNGNPRAYYFNPARGYQFSKALEQPVSMDPNFNLLLKHKHFPDMVPPIQPIKLFLPNTGSICQKYNTEKWSKDDWLTIVISQITGDRPLSDNFLRLLAVFPDSMSIEPIVEHRLQTQGGLKYIKLQHKKQRLQFPQFPEIIASELVEVLDKITGKQVQIQLPHFYDYSQFTNNKPIFEVYNEAVLLLQSRGPNADINHRPNFKVEELDFIKKYCPQISNSLHNHFVFQKENSVLPVTFCNMARFKTFASIVRCMWEGLRQTTPYSFWTQYVGSAPIPKQTIPSNGVIERKFNYATDCEVTQDNSTFQANFYALVDQCPDGLPGKGPITIWKPTQDEEHLLPTITEEQTNDEQETPQMEANAQEEVQEEKTTQPQDTTQDIHEEDIPGKEQEDMDQAEEAIQTKEFDNQNEVTEQNNDEKLDTQSYTSWYGSNHSLSDEERIRIETSFAELQERGKNSRLGYAQTNEVRYTPAPKKPSWAEIIKNSIDQDQLEKEHQQCKQAPIGHERPKQNQGSKTHLRPRYDENKDQQTKQGGSQNKGKGEPSNPTPDHATIDDMEHWQINTTCPDLPDDDMDVPYFGFEEEIWKPSIKDKKMIQEGSPLQRHYYITKHRQQQRILKHFQTDTKYTTMEEWFQHTMNTRPKVDFTEMKYTTGEPTPEQIYQLCKKLWTKPEVERKETNKEQWYLNWLMEGYETIAESKTKQEWIENALKENTDIDFSKVNYQGGEPTDKMIHEATCALVKPYLINTSQEGLVARKLKIYKQKKNLSNFSTKYVNNILTTYPTEIVSKTLEHWLNNTIAEHTSTKFPYLLLPGDEIHPNMVDVACQLYVTGTILKDHTQNTSNTIKEEECFMQRTAESEDEEEREREENCAILISMLDRLQEEQEVYFYNHITKYCNNTISHLCPQARLANTKELVNKPSIISVRLTVRFLHRIMNESSDKKLLQFSEKFYIRRSRNRYVKNIHVYIDTEFHPEDLQLVNTKKGHFQIIILGLSDLYDLWQEYKTTSHEIFYQEELQKSEDHYTHKGEHDKSTNHMEQQKAWNTQMPKLERIKAINYDENHGNMFHLTATEIKQYRTDPCHMATESFRLYEKPSLKDLQINTTAMRKYFMDAVHLASIMIQKTCPMKDTYKLDIPRFQEKDRIIFNNKELNFYESISKHCSHTASDLIQASQMVNSKQLIPYQRKDCVRLTHRLLHTIVNHETKKENLLYEQEFIITDTQSYVSDIYVHILPKTNINCLTQIQLGRDEFQIITNSIIDMHTLWNAYHRSAARLYMRLNIQPNWRQTPEERSQFVPSQHNLTNAWEETRQTHNKLRSLKTQTALDHTMYQPIPLVMTARDIQWHRQNPCTDSYRIMDDTTQHNIIVTQRERNFIMGQIHTAYTLKWLIQRQDKVASFTNARKTGGDKETITKHLTEDLQNKENFHQTRFFNVMTQRCININNTLKICLRDGEYIRKTPLTIQFLHKMVNNDIKEEDLVNKEYVHIPNKWDRIINNVQVYYNDEFQDGILNQVDVSDNDLFFQLDIPNPTILHQLWHEYYTSTQEYLYRKKIMPSQFITQQELKNPKRHLWDHWNKYRSTQPQIEQMLDDIIIKQIRNMPIWDAMDNLHLVTQLQLDENKETKKMGTEITLLKRRRTNTEEHEKSSQQEKSDCESPKRQKTEDVKDDTYALTQEQTETEEAETLSNTFKEESQEEEQNQIMEENLNYILGIEQPNYEAARKSLEELKDFLASDPRNLRCTPQTKRHNQHLCLHTYEKYEPKMTSTERADTSGIPRMGRLIGHMEEFIEHNMAEIQSDQDMRPIFYYEVHICRDCHTYHQQSLPCHNDDYLTVLDNTTFRQALDKARKATMLPDHEYTRYQKEKAYHVLAELSRINTIEQLYGALKPYKIITDFMEQTKPLLYRFMNNYEGPMFYPLKPVSQEDLKNKTPQDKDRDNTRKRPNEDKEKDEHKEQEKKTEEDDSHEEDEYETTNHVCQHITGSNFMYPVDRKPRFPTNFGNVETRIAARQILISHCKEINYNNPDKLCEECNDIHEAFHASHMENKNKISFNFPFQLSCLPQYVTDYISIMYTRLHCTPTSKKYERIINKHFNACKCFEHNTEFYEHYEYPKTIQTFWRTLVTNCEPCTHSYQQRLVHSTQNLSNKISDHQIYVIFQEIIKANCQSYSEEVGFTYCKPCRNAFRSIYRRSTDPQDIYHVIPFQLDCLTDNVNDFISHLYLRNAYRESTDKFFEADDAIGPMCNCFVFSNKEENQFPKCIANYWRKLMDTNLDKVDIGQHETPRYREYTYPRKSEEAKLYENISDEDSQEEDYCGIGIYEVMYPPSWASTDSEALNQTITTIKEEESKTTDTNKPKTGPDKPNIWIKRKSLSWKQQTQDKNQQDSGHHEEEEGLPTNKPKKKSALRRMKSISYKNIAMFMLILTTATLAEIKIPAHSSVAFESILTTTINPDYTLCTRQLDTAPWTKIIENMKYLTSQHRKVCDIYPNVVQISTENLFTKRDFEHPQHYLTVQSRAIYCSSINMQLPEIERPNGVHITQMADQFDMFIDAGIMVAKRPANAKIDEDSDTTLRDNPPTYRSNGQKVPADVLAKMCWKSRRNYGHNAYNEEYTYGYVKRGDTYELCRGKQQQLDYVVCMIPHISEINETTTQPQLLRHSSTCHLQNLAMTRQIKTLSDHANIFGDVAETLDETTINHQFPGQLRGLNSHQSSIEHNEQYKPHKSFMRHQRMRRSDILNRGTDAYTGMDHFDIGHGRHRRALITLGAPLAALGIWMVASSFWNVIANIASTTLAATNRHTINTLQTALENQIAQSAQQITDLRMETKELRDAVNTINTEIPRIENMLNSFMDQTYIYALQTTIEMLFLDARTAMDNHMTQFTFSLDAATRGNVSPYFLTDEDNRAIVSHFQQTLGVTVDTNRRNTVIAAYNTDNNTRLIYAFQIPDKSKEATIYKIHPIPRFINNTRVTPILEYPYIAITKHDLNFVQLTEGEMTQCLYEPRMCRAALPFRRISPGICGASEFYDQFTKCDMHISDDLSTFLYVLGNTTIYTTKEPTRAMINCNHLNRPGAEENYLLNGTGFITLAPGCAINIDDIHTKPANVYSLNFKEVALNTPAIHTKMEDMDLTSMEQELHDKINAPRHVYSAAPLNPHIRNHDKIVVQRNQATETALRTLYIIIITISSLMLLAGILLTWYAGRYLWNWYQKITKSTKRKSTAAPRREIVVDDMMIPDIFMEQRAPSSTIYETRRPPSSSIYETRGPLMPYNGNKDGTPSETDTSVYFPNTMTGENWTRAVTEKEHQESNTAQQRETNPLFTFRAMGSGDNTFLQNRQEATTTTE